VLYRRFLNRSKLCSWPRPTLLVAALGAALPLQAQTLAQTPPTAAQDDGAIMPLALRPTRVLAPSSRGSAEDKPALVLSGQSLSTRLDQESVAEGKAELRYGELLMSAQRLSYDHAEDLAQATGNVEVSRSGSVFKGPSLKLYVQRFEGEFLNPSYFFSLTGGGGSAERVQFFDGQHMQAFGGTYSSCLVNEGEQPAWQISTRSLTMNFDMNEGIATGAVLRFYGVPILAAPALSFPLGAQRKSGWLPPSFSQDTRSGFEFSEPYYWNIAPQRDATLTPFVFTRRGAGVDSEFRYLEPDHQGQLNLNLLPNDQVAGRNRWSYRADQSGALGDSWRYRVNAEHVSDDDYWKDMPSRMTSQTQRLLATDVKLSRRSEQSWGQAQVYARVQRWQALQGDEEASRFTTPYQRSPQVGLRLSSSADESAMDGFGPWGRPLKLEAGAEVEYNRFDLPVEALSTQTQTGRRVHLLGHISAPLSGSAWWLLPKLSVNMASYSLDQIQTDGRRTMSRTIPTFSLDHGWVFERETSLFKRAVNQTLEPRLLYVRTPYRAQDNMPNFDSAAKDFNADSIYTDNQFVGVDRVSDADQMTLGATSRWVSKESGEELLRLGMAQRFLFKDQRITPDGTVNTQRFSDVLLLGAAHLSTPWWLDSAVEVNPSSTRTARAVLGVRYAPGPFRTVSLAYRLVRDQSEQVELAWQWPLFGAQGRSAGSTRAGSASSGCGGAWYSAGRLQYSMRDSRLTDSVVGVEYDAGCWVLRVGAERLSTGLAETNTRLMLQLELVGLSQLGSNALKVLKDNIPGYRKLSSDRSAPLDASYD
jgi:LPS-assembly protein